MIIIEILRFIFACILVGAALLFSLSFLYYRFSGRHWDDR